MKELGFSKYSITKDGDIYSSCVNRFLKPASVMGYKFHNLTDDSGNLKNKTVHRLVAQMYLPNPDNLPQVNHIDGDKWNSRLSNLEWATPSQNTQHANDTGLRKQTFLTDDNKVPTEDEIIHDWTLQGLSELADDDVHKICQMLEDGYRVCDVSRMTGYNRRTVQYIRDDEKLKWKHIVSDYDFSKISKKLVTSPETVIAICQHLQDGVGVLEISRILSCDRKLVGNIKNRHTYKSVSCCYKF